MLCNIMLSMLSMEDLAPLWKLHVNLYRYVDSCQYRVGKDDFQLGLSS